MHEQEAAWREQADRLVAAPGFPFAEAARLAMAIAQASRDDALADAARQAAPALKAAAAEQADDFRMSIARRRFCRIRDLLQARAGPRFGRRPGSPSVAPAPETAREGAAERRLLGLPAYGEVPVEAVHAAFKQKAKAAHPDRGGTATAFAAIVAARDKLLGTTEGA